MPLLKFYTSPNQLTPAEKQELATVLTARYTRLLPAFYVSIVFNEVLAPLSHPLPPHISTN
jgi:phenylpyruvate tautomerase PptA (4-oxalocrotonate tautomerase family)